MRQPFVLQYGCTGYKYQRFQLIPVLGKYQHTILKVQRLLNAVPLLYMCRLYSVAKQVYMAAALLGNASQQACCYRQVCSCQVAVGNLLEAEQYLDLCEQQAPGELGYKMMCTFLAECYVLRLMIRASQSAQMVQYSTTAWPCHLFVVECWLDELSHIYYTGSRQAECW